MTTGRINQVATLRDASWQSVWLNEAPGRELASAMTVPSLFEGQGNAWIHIGLSIQQ